MKKYLAISLLVSLIISLLVVNSCKKILNPYDLFPLKMGNEFYYKYTKSDMIAVTRGTEAWKVVSASSNGGTIKYIIERNLNAVARFSPNDSMIITNRKTTLEVTEDKSSSEIHIWDLVFRRYQSVRQIELEVVGNTSMPSTTCWFKADSGLIRYEYYHPPNQVSSISLTIDSLKLIE